MLVFKTRDISNMTTAQKTSDHDGEAARFRCTYPMTPFLSKDGLKWRHDTTYGLVFALEDLTKLSSISLRKAQSMETV